MKTSDKGGRCWGSMLLRFACAVCLVWGGAATVAAQQAAKTLAQAGISPASAAPQTQVDESAAAGLTQANLQQGIDLTQQGRFAAAIPLLRAAQAAGVGGYAARFDLALCYVGSGDYRAGVAQLRALQADGSRTAAVSNLLAQAYLGEGDTDEAWGAMQAAAKLAPTDEKMYALLLNACTDHYDYALGLRIAELGLQSLPESARLHYERAVLLARLDRMNEAKPEFSRAAALGGTSDLGYLALVQEKLYEEQLPQALTIARKAVAEGHRDYQMLSLLGTILMYEGAAPGTPEFAEARNVLQESVAMRADYASSQIALGKLYLMESRVADAIAHLEAGRRLEPQDPAVYTSLAAAYRRAGNKQASAESLRVLAGLLREKTRSTAGGVVQP